MTGVLMVLLAVSAGPAAADTPGPGPGQIDAIAAKVNRDAATIHQLTEQLDQARLRVTATTAHLAGVTRQHDATVKGIQANRSVLLQQALRAYMHGGSTPPGVDTADMTLGREYLQVASGNLSNTGDQLRALEASLRGDLILVRGAEQANLQATSQLLALRSNALSVAGKEQQQLDQLQAQMTAARAQAAVIVSAGSPAPQPSKPPAQGLPVNNGLLSVVQQAAGLPVATSVVKPVSPSAPTGSTSGGVWLSLRNCESGNNYAENTGNGYYGAYQFSQATWTGLGYPGRPDQEPPAMQDEAAMKLQAQSGWGQWPACSAALGLTGPNG